VGVNTIHELHKKLVNGQISAVELTQRYIDRKDKSESDIQAFLSDSREAALAVAAPGGEKTGGNGWPSCVSYQRSTL